jgi:hypothetical protein
MKAQQTNTSPKPGTTRRLLEMHLEKLDLDALMRLSPLREKHSVGDLPFRQKRQEILRQTDQYVSQCRRILGYLGAGDRPNDWNQLSATAVVQQVVCSLENGDSYETIARFLNEWRTASRKQGRPSGSSVGDGIALRALELRESGPDKWSWSKIADELLECKLHKVHSWDDECTARLKVAVKALQSFVQELQATAYFKLP